MQNTSLNDTSVFRINRARLGFLVLGTAAFVSVLTQTPSSADAEVFKPMESGSAGSLVSRDHEVHLIYVDEGPRFTVTTREGALLASNLTLDQMQQQFGEIPLPEYAGQEDSPDETLMFVDDASPY
ncbi:MAG: hypothetical protein H6815_09615 [Phycisphaeraceae bacterium]|nr:hypothetical protein [Phycisphaerales bacterium]MCB9860694.1 hypothetical protein [Phycisphaeraceae bacterium]